MARKTKSKIVRRKNATHKQKKRKVKKLRSWKQNFFILAVVIFVGSIGYIFICSNFLNIYKIDVQGVGKINKNQIIDIVEHNMDSQIISCIKKRNYFFVNKKEIIGDILQDNRLKNVNITKKFPDTLIVEVQEHDSVVVWCKSEALETCFILEGEIAKRQVTMDESVIIENQHFVIVDETHHDILAGDRVMAEEYLEKIKILGQELLYVLDVEIEQPFKVASRGSHEVRFMTDEGWYIIIDLSQDSNEILDIAKLFVKRVDLPARRSDLEYVDMRFAEKIFYKMNDGVEQAVEENEIVDKSEDIKDDKDEGDDSEE